MGRDGQLLSPEGRTNLKAKETVLSLLQCSEPPRLSIRVCASQAQNMGGIDSILLPTGGNHILKSCAGLLFVRHLEFPSTAAQAKSEVS